ncbi:P-loop containing nucleoside triphosphate hydrolase protein [Phascolomyces articulosus]|uniref:ATP-dependent RNA helicase n=1 Tax=Phascolomyces articulosus TaxID=60185 RepID=A0AAD5KGB8_9FUNG|nr:P-loop containing nucleoside triphosphate hydrolase protein [Phascolomyces articulosus]
MLGNAAERTQEDIQLLRNMGIPDWLLLPTVISPSENCDLDALPGVSDHLVQRCRDLGFTSFFAVQLAVIPVFLRRQALYDTRRSPGDLCVSAPTGSGKTIAYVLPIIDILSKRIVTRLRALVVLPTRELAIQVKETFEAFVKGTNLRVGAAVGQHSMAREQQMLVGKNTDDLPGGQSRVDILIATPGRLTDHIKETRNFSLQHLRFLVIDEADQLLNQNYNDWLNQILTATRPSTDKCDTSFSFKTDKNDVREPDAIAPNFLRSTFDLPRTDIDLVKVPTVQKLLFSATLTKNPAKIAGLHLTEPEYISVQRSADAEQVPDYTTPEGLKEFMTVCSLELKPLHLIYLLHHFNIRSCLCFTRSTDSTRRLQMLVEAYEARQKDHDKIIVADYSSELAKSERKTLLKKFANGEINLLICSDLIGRGIDLDNVAVVINYDVPYFMDKYIHRVGRTARAGRTEKQEARPFKDMLRQAGHLQQMKPLRIDHKKLEPFEENYNAALSSLE